MTFARGDMVIFRSKTGRSWPAEVAGISRRTSKVVIQIEGDPFPVSVESEDLTCASEGGGVSSSSSSNINQNTRRKNVMPTETASKRGEARELLRKAKTLGIDGAESLSKVDLKAAVDAAEAGADAPAPRKRAAKPAAAAARPKVSKEQAEKVRPPSKRAPKAVANGKDAAAAGAPAVAAEKPARGSRKAAKATEAAQPAKRATKAPAATKAAKTPRAEKEPVEPGTNPFRKGTDRHVIFTLLAKGGTRKTLAERLQAKVTLRGPAGLTDYDKRILLTAQSLRDEHGYEIVREGRGLDGTIKVKVPA